MRGWWERKEGEIKINGIERERERERERIKEKRKEREREGKKE